jgi:hypothetical protein
MGRFRLSGMIRRRSFLLRKRRRVKERLHRRFAEAPSSLVRPFLIVTLDPAIKIDLQIGGRAFRGDGEARLHDGGVDGRDVRRSAHRQELGVGEVGLREYRRFGLIMALSAAVTGAGSCSLVSHRRAIRQPAPL